MLCILLACLATLGQTSTLYFSLPYRTILTDTLAQHLVGVEINRYPYLIDFTLNSAQDHILPLEWAGEVKQMADRADYRKDDQSVFGIVEFYGTQHADARLEWKRRTVYNAYYFARDFLQQTTWVNLNGVQQVGEKQAKGEAEGAFNFGPRNSDSQVLRNFRRYSRYMGDTVLTFRGNLADQNGQVIFGDFPTDIVLDGEVYSSNLDYLGEDYWIMTTFALQLHRRNGAAVDLYRETVRVRLALSERAVVIPVAAAEALKRTLPKCNFQERAQGGSFLACRDLKREDLTILSLNFTLSDSLAPLSVRLEDLELSSEGGTQWFAVRASEAEEYQIGEGVLRRYAIGVDYRSARLLYGPLAGQSSFSRSGLLKVFLVVNGVLFVVSAVLVAMEKRLRQRLKVAVRDELGLNEDDRPSKVNEYELASVTEETFAE